MDYFKKLQNKLEDIFFVQMGAMDGITDDFVFPLIKKYKWRGLLVEPREDKFQILKNNYKTLNNIKFANVAIDKEIKKRKIYFIKNEDIIKYNLPDWVNGISSFYKNQLSLVSHVPHLYEKAKNDKLLHKKLEETNANLTRNITSSLVDCWTLKKLFNNFKVKHVDILIIDTEGADFMIFEQFDFSIFSPYVVWIEIKHMSKVNQDKIMHKLKNLSYNVKIHTNDLLAIKEI